MILGQSGDSLYMPGLEQSPSRSHHDLYAEERATEAFRLCSCATRSKKATQAFSLHFPSHMFGSTNTKRTSRMQTKQDNGDPRKDSGWTRKLRWLPFQHEGIKVSAFFHPGHLSIAAEDSAVVRVNTGLSRQCRFPLEELIPSVQPTICPAGSSMEPSRYCSVLTAAAQKSTCSLSRTECYSCSRLREIRILITSLLPSRIWWTLESRTYCWTA